MPVSSNEIVSLALPSKVASISTKVALKPEALYPRNSTPEIKTGARQVTKRQLILLTTILHTFSQLFVILRKEERRFASFFVCSQP